MTSVQEAECHRRWQRMPPVELEKELEMLRWLMPGCLMIRLLEAFIPEQLKTYAHRE